MIVSSGLASQEQTSALERMGALMTRPTFEQLGAACARVLARQAAIRLAKDELQRQGQRLTSVPARDIQLRADQLLAAHPHLIDEAASRVAAHPEKWFQIATARALISLEYFVTEMATFNARND